MPRRKNCAPRPRPRRPRFAPPPRASTRSWRRRGAPGRPSMRPARGLPRRSAARPRSPPAVRPCRRASPASRPARRRRRRASGMQRPPLRPWRRRRTSTAVSSPSGPGSPRSAPSLRRRGAPSRPSCTRPTCAGAGAMRSRSRSAPGPSGSRARSRPPPICPSAWSAPAASTPPLRRRRTPTSPAAAP